MQHPYLEAYLDEVVENQGRLFDLVAMNYPDKDIGDFIEAYMASSTRRYIDESQAYVSTKDAYELLEYFLKNEGYSFKEKAVTAPQITALPKTAQLMAVFQGNGPATSQALNEATALGGFLPLWIGDFYAYYQWYYNVPSRELVKKLPAGFLIQAYAGLGGLDLELAVRKVGKVER